MASYGIVTTEDFTGTLYIQLDECANVMQSYIDALEDKYLYELLGITNANLLINDLVDGVPQSPEILEWFNAFRVEDECTGDLYCSEGIKKMLTYLIYYEYIRGEELFVSDNGVVKIGSENSERKDSIITERFIRIKAWNKAVDTWRALQYKLELSNKGIDKAFF